MKKIAIFGALLAAVSCALAFAPSESVNAACGHTLYIGNEALSCGRLSEGQTIDGFSIDADANKITLNNFNGGAFYFICAGSCKDFENYEIELIGENKIDASIARSSESAHYPENVAFYNVFPTFTGSGSLKIVSAKTPFMVKSAIFDGSYELNIVGSDKVIVANDEVVDDAIDAVDGTVGANPSLEEIIAQNPEPMVERNFFSSDLGVLLFFAIPGFLLLVIIVLIIMLCLKGKGKKVEQKANIAEQKAATEE